MQTVDPFAGSIQQHLQEIAGPGRHRPAHCPQCGAKEALRGHGFHARTLVDLAVDGVIRVRRYWRRLSKPTVSLLPRIALPWLRFSLTVRFECGGFPCRAGPAAKSSAMPSTRVSAGPDDRM